MLDEEKIKQLLDIHLDSIKFSFQGADEETYNEMRNGGDYMRLLDTIRLFSRMRGDMDYPYIQISTTLTDESDEQLDSFKRDVSDYCDSYNIGYTLLDHIDENKMNI